MTEPMKEGIRRQGDGTWEIKFDIGTDPLTGKRRTRYATFEGTRNDAKKKRAELIADAAKGNDVDPSKQTVSEYLDEWKQYLLPNVTPKTAERYLELIELHVKPHIGAARLQKLRTDHLVQLYAKLARPKEQGGAGLSGRTANHVHRVLHKALSYAMVGLKRIPNNPAATISSEFRPKVEKAKIEILSKEDAGLVLQKLRGRAMYPIASLGLATGMRRGEILALRWKDIDFDGATVRVERALEQTKQGLRFKAPKTEHGERTITLPSWAVTDLRDHWKEQQKLRLRLGQGKAPDDGLVFCNFDGSPRRPNAVTNEWKRNVSVLELPRVSLHALRHTHASQLIRQGMDVVAVSKRLGHGSPAITLTVYAKQFDEAKTDTRAADIMEDAFGKALSE